jgi:UDP-N-acetylglucosamine 2-epimerase (non-hydrolysing)
MKRIMVAYGTRPEAIKVAPLIRKLQSATDFQPIVTITGQHREMLDQVNEQFGIVPDYDLDLMSHGAGLETILARTLTRLTQLIARESPDALIVQGDTSSAMAAALCAYYCHVPVFHLEAGLRSNDIYNPFPEEVNRRIIATLARQHFAPTEKCRANLIREGAADIDIYVTGNTVIDALMHTATHEHQFNNSDLAQFVEGYKRLVLVTAHRRESWGARMREISEAVLDLAREFPDHGFVFPMHRNRLVRETIQPILFRRKNILLTEPLSYPDFTRVLSAARVALTDSGGVQEEAPSLGTPVLVVRETTERPEAVEAGAVRLVGTKRIQIRDATRELLTQPLLYESMSQAVNPYGDGKAAQRVLDAMRHFFEGSTPRPSHYVPSGC